MKPTSSLTLDATKPADQDQEKDNNKKRLTIRPAVKILEGYYKKLLELCIYGGVIALFTYTAASFFGIDIQELIEMPWYWITLGSAFVLFFIAVVLDESNISAIRAITRLVVVLAILMATINALWPGTTLQDVKKIDLSLNGQETRTADQKPQWKTVYGPKEFIGKGFSGGKYGDGSFPVAEYEKDYLQNQVVIIRANNAQFYGKNGFEDINGILRIPVKYPKKNSALYLRAPKGERVVVKTLTKQ